MRFSVSVLDPQKRNGPINGPHQTWEFVKGKAENLEVEQLGALYLDAAYKLMLHDPCISRGSVDFTPATPREVFTPAVRIRASYVVVYHNHPCGDPTPSTPDIKTTLALKQAGDILGIPLLDHIVIGHGVFTSIIAAINDKIADMALPAPFSIPGGIVYPGAPAS